MRLHLFVFAATFALAACATPNDDSGDAVADAPAPEAPAKTAPASAAPVPPMVEPCNEGDVKRFVGQQATDDVVEQARVASSAKTTRVIKPGMAVTMDYRGDRLNVNTDASGKIESLSCG